LLITGDHESLLAELRGLREQNNTMKRGAQAELDMVTKSVRTFEEESMRNERELKQRGTWVVIE